MRLVLDTNVLIAAIISHGTCFELFEYCLKNHAIIASEYIVDEFARKLVSKFKFSKSEAALAGEVVFEKIFLVKPADIESIKGIENDDLPIIGTAFSGKCKMLVTGDKALQKLSKYKHLRIVSPFDFWRSEPQ